MGVPARADPELEAAADLGHMLETALRPSYSLERELGGGGMSRVFLATETALGRRVVIKVLPPELATTIDLERFRREVRLAASLQHPHIVPLLAAGQAGDLLYYTMPYIEGESLKERLARLGPISPSEVIRLLRELADALAYAHGRGVVHRDIKPANVLLSGHALLADFGIAKALTAAATLGKRAAEPALTTTGQILGTPVYMAPEQALGDPSADHRVDLYALGCVAYEMLTGRPPFTGASLQALVAAHLLEVPAPLREHCPQVPVGLETLVLQLLSKDPDFRPTSSAMVLELLEKEYVAGGGSGSERAGIAALTTSSQSSEDRGPPSARATAVSRARLQHPGAERHRSLRLAALASLLAVTAAGIAVGLRASRHPPPAGTTPRWVLVADLDAPRDDPGLATAVRELVTAALEQSSAVVPMPRQQLEDVMRSAGLADTVPLKGSLARELAVRASVRAILGGSVLPVGHDRYAVVLRVIDPDSGTTIVSASRTAAERDLVPAVQDAAREIRRGLGERRGVLGVGPSLRHVATPSFAAFRKFVEGTQLSDGGDPLAGIRAQREAIELDTAFALAWAAMSTNYIVLHELDSAGIAVQEALRHPDRLTDAQRYRLESEAAYALHYDIPAAVRWYDRLLQVLPNSISGINNRATLVYSLGRYEEALAGFARAESLESFGPEGARIEIFNQAVTLLALGREADAAATARRLTGPFADYAAVLLALQQGRWAAAESVASGLIESPSTPSFFRLPSLTAVASTAAARGDPMTADRQLREAARADPSNGSWYANALLLLAEAGGRTPGPVPAWLTADTSSAGLVSAGLWAAIARDTGLARRRLVALQRRAEPERRRLGHSLELIEAYLLRTQGRWSDVARVLGPAAAAGELDGGDGAQVSSAALRWLMAEAYENLAEPDSAIAMYERILDPRRTPFTHLTLRGLVHRFALERRDALRRQETIRGTVRPSGRVVASRAV